jgi:hypothetical protein
MAFSPPLSIDTTPAPEPGSAALLATGAGLLALLKRRRVVVGSRYKSRDKPRLNR